MSGTRKNVWISDCSGYREMKLFFSKKEIDDYLKLNLEKKIFKIIQF